MLRMIMCALLLALIITDMRAIFKEVEQNEDVFVD